MLFFISFWETQSERLAQALYKVRIENRLLKVRGSISRAIHRSSLYFFIALEQNDFNIVLYCKIFVIFWISLTFKLK